MWTIVMSWLKNNWKWFRWVLVIPVVLICLKHVIRILTVLFKKEKKPDTSAIDKKYDSKIQDANKKAEEEKKKIDEEKNKIKNGIDSGNPTPSDIFNKELKK